MDGKIWNTTVDTDYAGNIVFDNGKEFGYMKTEFSLVKGNGDYYFYQTTKGLSLYVNTYNPGKFFNFIEISSIYSLMGVSGASTTNDVKIENLALKFASAYGITVGISSNHNVSGCEIAYIGGGYHKSDEFRVGNAIKFCNGCSGSTVENNYIYQIYDAAVTFQGQSSSIFDTINISNNLIENTTMNFEFWSADAEGRKDNV